MAFLGYALDDILHMVKDYIRECLISTKNLENKNTAINTEYEREKERERERQRERERKKTISCLEFPKIKARCTHSHFNTPTKTRIGFFKECFLWWLFEGTVPRSGQAVQTQRTCQKSELPQPDKHQKKADC